MKILSDLHSSSLFTNMPETQQEQLSVKLTSFFENILLFMTVKVNNKIFSLPSLAAPLRLLIKLLI